MKELAVWLLVLGIVLGGAIIAGFVLAVIVVLLGSAMYGAVVAFREIRAGDYTEALGSIFAIAVCLTLSSLLSAGVIFGIDWLIGKGVFS